MKSLYLEITQIIKPEETDFEQNLL